MAIIWSREADEILRQGYYLGELGVSNWGLTEYQALAAFERFLTLKIPILGGDVYETVNGNIQPNYDSWYCNQLQGEVKDDFVVRSIGVSESYIRNYDKSTVESVLFILVPGTQ